MPYEVIFADEPEFYSAADAISKLGLTSDQFFYRVHCGQIKRYGQCGGDGFKYKRREIDSLAGQLALAKKEREDLHVNE